MDWLFQSLTWYSYLFLLGIIFFPISNRVFGDFADRGYAAAKTIGILVLSYSTFLLGILKISQFTQLNLIVLILFFAFLNSYLYFSKKQHIPFTKKVLFLLLFEEILFLVSFLFLAYVRGQEPSIRGLEKFMDFGFMNSILRSTYFPPLDIWLSADLTNPQGYPINYYYFGHLTGAVLIKLTGILPFVGYNLILATILGQGMILTFSLVSSLVYLTQKNFHKNNQMNLFPLIFFGLLGSFIVNLAGNLHTIYLFTKGYPNEAPVPFWEILSTYNPVKYWYPNATRFIPFTIHEFPSYSFVVADLHGHVFDIPFVLLTISILVMYFLKHVKSSELNKPINVKHKVQIIFEKLNITSVLQITSYQLLITIFLGFLIAIHYTTNALDGPIYLLLTLLIFLIMFRLSRRFIALVGILLFCFVLFSIPFSAFFSPFISGIGVNCSPDFLVTMQKLGPFLFEKGNCQISAWWMLVILWGFFWGSLLIFIATLILQKKLFTRLTSAEHFHLDATTPFDIILLIFFSFSTFLIFIPEFFYFKDIYPAHFRANTMFKLGYQAFMIMGIASTYVLYRIKFLTAPLKYILKGGYLLLFFFIFIYPFYAFPSYYGNLKKTPNLDGASWLQALYPEDREIIDFINTRIDNQPVILEAQGDSYTDYERISAYTGVPTVAGWWVHEWLWRGSSAVVGNRIPDITAIYESIDIPTTKNLLKKYHVQYVVISTLERNKYPNLNETKFNDLGRKVFTSSNQRGALYQIVQY